VHQSRGEGADLLEVGDGGWRGIREIGHRDQLGAGLARRGRGRDATFHSVDQPASSGSASNSASIVRPRGVQIAARLVTNRPGSCRRSAHAMQVGQLIAPAEAHRRLLIRREHFRRCGQHRQACSGPPSGNRMSRLAQGRPIGKSNTAGEQAPHAGSLRSQFLIRSLISIWKSGGRAAQWSSWVRPGGGYRFGLGLGLAVPGSGSFRDRTKMP